MGSANVRSNLNTDPVRNFRFLVQFLPHTVNQKLGFNPTLGFTSVSGLSVSTESIPYREGGYNAQPFSSKVLTVNGWKTMGEIEVGDRVIDPYGQDSKVTGVYPKGVRDVYRVTLRDGSTTEACYQHLWETHNPSWDAPRVLDTLALKALLEDEQDVALPTLPLGADTSVVFSNVESVEFVRQDEVQCISVSADSHLYVTDNYIATHNTTVHQIPGQSTFGPITMQRGLLLGTMQHWNWMERLFSVAGNKQASGDFRCDVNIYVLAHPSSNTASSSIDINVRTSIIGKVMDDKVHQKFRVYNAWPTTVAYSDLNAGDNALMVEQLTLVHEGFDMVIANDVNSDVKNAKL